MAKSVLTVTLSNQEVTDALVAKSKEEAKAGRGLPLQQYFTTEGEFFACLSSVKLTKNQINEALIDKARSEARIDRLGSAKCRIDSNTEKAGEVTAFIEFSWLPNNATRLGKIQERDAKGAPVNKEPESDAVAEASRPPY